MITDKSLASIVPYGHILDDGTVYLRGRGWMLGFEFHGLPWESTSDAQLTAASERMTEAMRHLGTGDMLQAIYHRLPSTHYPRRDFPSEAARLIDEERRQQFESEHYWQTRSRLYITTEIESAARSGLRSAVFGTDGWRPHIDLVLQRFHERIQKFQDALGGTIELRRLTAEETFRDLILSVTGKDYPAILPAGYVRLNEVIASERWYGGVAPAVGQLHLRPVCVTGYPGATAPQWLALLLRNPGLLTLSARFITLDPVDAQDALRLERLHWVRESKGTFLDIIRNTIWPSSARKNPNQDSEIQLASVNEAITAAAGGLPFGWLTVTAVYKDNDADRATAAARNAVKDLSAIGITARVEDANADEAVIGTWPGEGVANIRRPMVNAGNFAELTLPVEHWPGTQLIDSPFYQNHATTPLTNKGTGHQPFYLPTHIGGVANQLIIGPTGSGKSMLLGAMIAATTGVPGVRIAWLDVDYSSFVLAHALGADYIELAQDQSSALTPLRHLNDDNGISWLFDWFTRLMQRWEINLDEVQSADLISALELAKSNNIRNLGIFETIIQDQRLRGVLANYIGTGSWSHIFNGDDTGGKQAPLTVYEMRSLMALGERAAGPATELILHGVERTMGGHPTFIYADEAWTMLTDKVSSAWLFDAIRTFRKRNAGIVMATQSLGELVDSPYCNLLLESCPGKIFLPNPEANGDHVRKAYLAMGLNEKEISVIARAAPRRQYYFHSQPGRRLFELACGPIQLRLCGSTGAPDVAQARALFNTYGPDLFAQAWLNNLPASRNGTGHTYTQSTDSALVNL